MKNLSFVIEVLQIELWLIKSDCSCMCYHLLKLNFSKFQTSIIIMDDENCWQGALILLKKAEIFS